MNSFPLSTDDLPPTVSTYYDWILRQQLEKACRQSIYNALMRHTNQQENQAFFLYRS